MAKKRSPQLKYYYRNQARIRQKQREYNRSPEGKAAIKKYNRKGYLKVKQDRQKLKELQIKYERES